jgi:catechol 2,3-dioxygenase-like lactoylglutathione lyase family enzyme
MSGTDSPWTKLTHIGLVVRDIEKTLESYGALGIGPFKRFDLPSDEFIAFKSRHHFGKPADGHVYKVAWGSMGPIAVEIFQPVAGDSIPQRWLDAKGEGIWHYGYDVDDMAQTIAFMEARGYAVIGASEHEDGTLMCYFGTDAVGGVYFQAHQLSKASTMHELSTIVKGSPS